MPTSTSDVISSGRYLDDSFDPSKLTVPVLNGILHYHGVNIPQKLTKEKLVKLFQSHITANSSKLKEARHTQLSTTGSCDGIQDGITGDPLQYVAVIPHRICPMSVKLTSEIREVQQATPGIGITDRMDRISGEKFQYVSLHSYD